MADQKLIGVIDLLRQSQDETKEEIVTTRHSIQVMNNEIVKNAIMFLSDQFINNGSIEKKDIISSINKFMISENSNTGQKIEYIIKTPKKSVVPRSI